MGKRGRHIKDLTGQVFGHLSVLSCHEVTPRGTFWIAQCSCGKRRTIRGSNLTSGNTKACGHLRGRATKRRAVTRDIEQPLVRRVQRVPLAYTLTGDRWHPTPEYTVWRNMKARCTKPINPSYHNYGGRGITVCERWMSSFSNFLADMGRKPDAALTIERINNNGNYEPGNCEWATCKKQTGNRRKS